MSIKQRREEAVHAKRRMLFILSRLSFASLRCWVDAAAPFLVPLEFETFVSIPANSILPPLFVRLLFFSFFLSKHVNTRTTLFPSLPFSLSVSVSQTLRLSLSRFIPNHDSAFQAACAHTHNTSIHTHRKKDTHAHTGGARWTLRRGLNRRNKRECRSRTVSLSSTFTSLPPLLRVQLLYPIRANGAHTHTRAHTQAHRQVYTLSSVLTRQANTQRKRSKE